MYNNEKGARVLLVYNFIGAPKGLNEEQLREDVEYVGLNDLVTSVTETINEKDLKVEEALVVTREAFDNYIEGFLTINEHKDIEKYKGFRPWLDDIVLLDVKEDGTSYDVYTINDSGYIPEESKEIINNIVKQVDNIADNNVIVVIVDLVARYAPIVTQIRL